MGGAERYQPETIIDNGAVPSGETRSDDLPKMSEVLTSSVITAIHKDEAVVGYRAALRDLGVPQKDILRNSYGVELKLLPLANGGLRKHLASVYGAIRGAQDYITRREKVESENPSAMHSMELRTSSIEIFE